MLLEAWLRPYCNGNRISFGFIEALFSIFRGESLNEHTHNELISVAHRWHDAREEGFCERCITFTLNLIKEGSGMAAATRWDGMKLLELISLIRLGRRGVVGAKEVRSGGLRWRLKVVSVPLRVSRTCQRNNRSANLANGKVLAGMGVGAGVALGLPSLEWEKQIKIL